MKADPVGSTAGADKEGALPTAVGGDSAVSRVKKAEDVEALMEVKIGTDVPVSPSGKSEVSTTSTYHQRGSRCSKP